jgi:hypothetical protein
VWAWLGPSPSPRLATVDRISRTEALDRSPFGDIFRVLAYPDPGRAGPGMAIGCQAFLLLESRQWT